MPKVRVRPHLRRLSDGSVTMVREHFRGNPAPTAAIGLGAAVLVVLLIVGVIFLWPSSPDTSPAASAERTAAAQAGRPGTTSRLASSLQEVREQSGLSLAEAARRSGLPRAKITQFERGSVLPDARELDELCQTYDVTPEVRNQLMDLQWTAAESP